MTKLTSEELVDLIAKSNLVATEKYDRLVKLIREKYEGVLPNDPARVAAIFKHNKLLTEWQIEKLLARKYKGFFLGRYKLLGHLGTGGMSSVYLAEHTKMKDRRAIKVLPKGRVKDASYLARFQNEAKAIAALNHPNIVRAFDIDHEGDTHYMVMEHVDGDDLQVRVRKNGPLDFRTVADVAIQAARGLEHAHQRGMIHRDVKPANLLIDSNGTVRLLDMGLALFKETEEASLTIAHNENVLGTADYLAPEQARSSHDVDHRADIYGLGCTLYFILTGQPPFNEGSLAQRIAKHQNEMPKSIRQLRPDCPGELEGMVVKMIQKEPEYRYQTAAAVADAMERWVATSRIAAGGKGVQGEGGSAGVALGSSGMGLPVETDEGSGTSFDTVSNQGGDTLAGSRSSISSLSASDSGKLVSVTPRHRSPADSSGGSAIDLERESGYTSRPIRAKTPGGIQLPPAKEEMRPEELHKVRLADPSSGTQQVPWLLVAFFVVMLLVALAVGFFIARLTA